MPLDHTSIAVPSSKLDPLVTFLTAALAPIGIKEMMRPIPQAVGLGDVAPIFWLNTLDPSEANEATQVATLKKAHIAFTATSVDQVDAFYHKALKAGGVDNGAPGLREHYHKGYYAAFVRDPVCGVNWEVVFHGGAGNKS